MSATRKIMTAVPMTATETADYAALLERAHALLPFLREHAPQAEKLRQLPAEVVKAPEELVESDPGRAEPIEK